MRTEDGERYEDDPQPLQPGGEDALKEHLRRLKLQHRIGKLRRKVARLQVKERRIRERRFSRI